MGFRDLTLGISYSSEEQGEMISSFFVPVLRNSISYDRASGYFTSESLFQIAKGLAGLLENNGTMRLVVSPQLSSKDIESINLGYNLKDGEVVERIEMRFRDPVNDLEVERLNYLAHLIADGRLDIKIATTINNAGIFHEKYGIMTDPNGEVIAFSGSLNETGAAYSLNFESIEIFNSWEDAKRIVQRREAFNKLWNNSYKGLKVLPFPEALKLRILKYKKESILSIDPEVEEVCDINDKGYLEITKKFYEENQIEFREYQFDAFKKWANNGFQGIYSMATGTGKTITAIMSMSNILKINSGSKLLVIILCPYIHLVDQWCIELKQANFNSIPCYGSVKWKDSTNRNLLLLVNERIDHLILVSSMDTFMGNDMQFLLEKFNYVDRLLIADEMHNLGSKSRLKILESFQCSFKLGLTATPKRHFDDEGTQKLAEYFGQIVYEFDLGRAIRENFLTKYYYYPVITYLSDDEYLEYKSLSKKISKLQNYPEDKREGLELLLIKRARILNSSVSKLDGLNDLFVSKNFTNTFNNLVYCGDGSVVLDEDDGNRQIDLVSDLLGNQHNMCIRRFTSEETNDTRRDIIDRFINGDDLQAIIAIKCLDEGVNIPSIKRAFILASSTNSKEFIQRRGRVLRKSKGKEFAEIYDFVCLPYPSAYEDEIKINQSIIKHETSRMEEYSNLAENFYEALKVIHELFEKYYMI